MQGCKDHHITLPASTYKVMHHFSKSASITSTSVKIATTRKVMYKVMRKMPYARPTLNFSIIGIATSDDDKLNNRKPPRIS